MKKSVLNQSKYIMDSGNFSKAFKEIYVLILSTEFVSLKNKPLNKFARLKTMVSFCKNTTLLPS